MVKRWRSGLAAVAVTVATVVLVLLDLSDDDVRSWWAGHAFTCSTLSGLLVLLVTVLVVDQVADLRRARSRGRATAAQAAIVLGQARRSSRSVAAALDGGGGGGGGGGGDGGDGQDDASTDVRNYLMMLLVSGPVLIDTMTSRAFLEEAQRYGALVTRLLGDPPPDAHDQLDDASGRLEAIARPLVDVLHPAERAAATADDGMIKRA